MSWKRILAEFFEFERGDVIALCDPSERRCEEFTIREAQTSHLCDSCMNYVEPKQLYATRDSGIGKKMHIDCAKRVPTIKVREKGTREWGTAKAKR